MFKQNKNLIKLSYTLPVIVVLAAIMWKAVYAQNGDISNNPIENYAQWAELEEQEFGKDSTSNTGTGQIYYVDQSTGNDSNPGTTEALPLQTITQANQKVAPGDIVYVKKGTYEENIIINASGNPQNWITFKAFPGHRPYVVGTYDGTFRVQGNYIVIDGFKVTSTKLGSGIHVGRNNHHTKILNNEIHDSGCGGISGQETDYLYIEGNITYRNAFKSGYQCSGISIYQAEAFDYKPGAHNIIRGNISFANENKVAVYQGNVTDGNGIIIDDLRHTQNSQEPRYTPWTLVENNIVFDNGGRGIHVFQSDNVVIRNNTAFRNVRSTNLDGHLKGELSTFFSSNILFYNNIAYASGPSKFTFVDDYSQNNQWDYNLSFNGSILVNDGNSDVVLGKNNLVNVNPRFVSTSVSPTRANFCLPSTSPAIDAGTPIIAASKDLNGKLRPFGNKYDIGAYEFTRFPGCVRFSFPPKPLQ